MKLSAKKNLPKLTEKDCIAVLLTQELADTIKKLPAEISTLLKNVDMKYFKGKPAELFFSTALESATIILCGLGPEKKADLEGVRNACAALPSLCKEKGITTLHLLSCPVEDLDTADVNTAAAEGIYLANYSFEKYINTPKAEKKTPLQKTVIVSSALNLSKKLSETEIICTNTLLCRDLVNDTSEASNPVAVAGVAKKLAAIDGITCKVFGKKEIEKMKMGLLLAVNRGSKVPPRFVVLTYKGDPGTKKFTALVGKGITFDSGGVNLKPSGHIETMRMDMAGAATAMYALKTIAELKLKKNVYAVMPLTENMIAGDAYRPGDIFPSYSGKTVEIGNTDAEGRLILADALAYTVKQLKPRYIIDLATLTGACLVALGETVAAMLSNNDELKAALKGASESTGERIWELPLFSDYEDNMKSEIADISNMAADRNAGTINAAVFLKNFIDDAKWAHLDIAGTAWYSKPRGYRPKNATGFGVRLLTETVRALK